MSNNEKIAFLDLASLHQELEPELLPVFQKVMRTAGFVGGPMVEEFERDFAKFCDAAHCVGLASGTDAVRFALMAAGVQPGDVVITVPHTFIATTEAISQAGARLDFVDIDERTYNMDPAEAEGVSGAGMLSRSRNRAGRIIASGEPRLPPLCRCIFTGNARTWIPFWNWRGCIS